MLGLLRDIEQNNGFAAECRRELSSEIQSLERHYFVEPAAIPPDLPSIAKSWVGRASWRGRLGREGFPSSLLGMMGVGWR